MTTYGPQPLTRVLRDLQLTEAFVARRIGVRKWHLGQVLDGDITPSRRMVGALVELTGRSREELFTAAVLARVYDRPSRPTYNAPKPPKPPLPEAEISRLRRAVGFNPPGGG